MMWCVRAEDERDCARPPPSTKSFGTFGKIQSEIIHIAPPIGDSECLF